MIIIPHSVEMGVCLGKVREGEGFQLGHVLAHGQVILPLPALGRVAAVISEHGDHLVGKAAGHGEEDPGPELPHRGALDIADLPSCFTGEIEILKSKIYGVNMIETDRTYLSDG